MAAEGRAFYIPGKTTEEIKAKQAADAAALDEKTLRKVSLTQPQWRAVDSALPDMVELLFDVRTVLGTLAYAASMDSTEVGAILRLGVRAVQAFEEHDGVAISDLDFAIRHAQKEDAA